MNKLSMMMNSAVMVYIIRKYYLILIIIRNRQNYVCILNVDSVPHIHVCVATQHKWSSVGNMKW